MNVPAVCRELENLRAGTVRSGEPMQRYTTWRIGGPADILIEPQNVAGLVKVLNYARGKSFPVTVIGSGSNLLVRDGGIRGVVVKIGPGLASLKTSEKTVIAGAGVKLNRLTAAAREAGIGGLEFLAGIPGTMGGAVVMNAGANGAAMRDLVKEVTVVDPAGRVSRLPGDELGFGYRQSNLKSRSLIVVEATCLGVFKKPGEIQAAMENFLARRRASQPLARPSAGSVFKNPPEEAAGRLIELAGVKGLRVGDAQVSPVHANFIVNIGAAAARDVLELIDRVRELVDRRFGVRLQLEVEVVGED